MNIAMCGHVGGFFFVSRDLFSHNYYFLPRGWANFFPHLVGSGT